MNMSNKRIHSVFHEARPLDSVLISPIGDRVILKLHGGSVP